MERLTVGALKKALEGMPDELEVQFMSDTEESGEVILESAYRVNYTLPDNQFFEDTGDNVVDFFAIYGNAKEDDDYLDDDLDGHSLEEIHEEFAEILDRVNDSLSSL